jgi:hypothetical protein
MKPVIKTKYGVGVGVQIFIQHPDLSDLPTTYLSADEALGQTTLSVISESGFTTADYVLIGNWEEETSEIRKITSTSVGAIVTDATTFVHPRGTKITFIPFNQITVSRSTDGTTYTPLTAVGIQPDALWTSIMRTADASTDYYKARFYNSTTTLYSDYSDVVVGEYAYNTVYAVKNRALSQMGEKVNDLISDEFLNEALWEGRRELDNDPKVLRYSFRTKTNYNLGGIVPGTNTATLPTDLRDPHSVKNILGVRIGKDNQQLTYVDWNDLQTYYYGVAHTTLSGAVLTADTSITLTDSGDFLDSGNIDVAAADTETTVDTVAYTANDLSSNVISGVTGIVATGHATLTDVWQDANFGFPTAYSVDAENHKIVFNYPFEDDLAGENIYLDYYATLPTYDSDADVLDEPEVDLFVSYLKYKIKALKSNGKLAPQNDGDYVLWLQGKNALINKELLGQTVRFFID